MKPPGTCVSTYIARLPSGACRTKGPPWTSAVVCGCGLPATVPPTADVAAPAGVVMLPA
jgi:hypothetical protein